MRLTLEQVSDLYSRAGISHPEKYHDATISRKGVCMAVQFRFKRETRLRLWATTGDHLTKNLREITEYYLEHFWGRPDTEYSSLLIAYFFGLLVEDYFKTCEAEQQEEQLEEPDKGSLRDSGPESGAPPGRSRKRRKSGGKSSGETGNPQCQPADEHSERGRKEKRRRGNKG